MISHRNFNIKEFYDAPTNTMTYFVFDPKSKDAVLIDPVLNYDAHSGFYSFDEMNKYLAFIEEHDLNIHYFLETHAHADHLTASFYLREKLPKIKIGIGKNITVVQRVFAELFHMNIHTDGSQFDHLFEDGEVIEAGSLAFKVLFTPGHTPACTSLLFEDALFTGDALFMPDYGTGRCDFPKGSASDLYDSITQKIYTLPDETKIYTGHDYQPGGRELRFETSVGESKESNVRLTEQTTKEDFVKFRSERDATLSAPKLLLPSIQVNIQGGKLPEPESNGLAYLKIPLRQA